MEEGVFFMLWYFIYKLLASWMWDESNKKLDPDLFRLRMPSLGAFLRWCASPDGAVGPHGLSALRTVFFLLCASHPQALHSCPFCQCPHLASLAPVQGLRPFGQPGRQGPHVAHRGGSARGTIASACSPLHWAAAGPSLDCLFFLIS